MKLITKIFFCVFIIALFIAGLYLYLYHGSKADYHKTKIEFVKNNNWLKKLHIKSQEAKQYAGKHHLSTQYSFMIDMSEPSGKDRFYVYDLQGDSIAADGLVAHGCGNESFAYNASFSNQPNSNCTSLGRYKVGGKYAGRFGDAWKLFGLDSSNNKAFERNIVLHAYGCVPDKASYPLPICNSRGCPMVSYTFLKILKGFIEDSDKPVLLWIYE